mmetsp:Transcript_13127/g.21288  ORF Transcript_13127/g.21288 Transcript_13127/m.21288 type:complete len:232 (+) Transcript_13127:39-734(+)
MLPLKPPPRQGDYVTIQSSNATAHFVQKNDVAQRDARKALGLGLLILLIVGLYGCAGPSKGFVHHRISQENNLLGGKSSYVCPGSAAYVHASCKVKVNLEASCSDVLEELQARVTGQNTHAWSDPHNNGTYTMVKNESSTVYLTRVTGDHKYTDKLVFNLVNDSETSCIVFGCSESQVFSVADFGTNFCNLYNLYCNTKDCKPVKHSIKSSTPKITKSYGASASPSACVKN